MRALRTLTATATALAAAAALHSSVHAYATYAHWASSTATFYVNPVNMDVPQADAITAIQTGMDAWNTQAGISFRLQYGGTVNDTATAFDNRNVVMFRNATNGSAIATTYSWWNSNNELLDSDVVFWDAGFAFYTGTTCGPLANAAYIEDIAAHELGHAIGMSHSTVTDATMYPSYSYCSDSNRTLSSDDIAGVRTLYPTGSPSSTPTNTAPSVTLSSPTNGASYANGATVSFSGSASDTEDGVLTSALAWTSNIDGAIGSGGSFSRVLSAGTHTITASVQDSGGLTTAKQVSITVAAASTSSPTPTGPTLSATGRKVKGYEKADLKWSGLSSTSADVYRNSSKIMTTSNSGSTTDPINKKGSGTYTYTVCEAGTSTCTNAATVTF
jgi:hypothetical protein